jgi:16S rRNA (guanine966-N2)-methyltransferase
MRVIGGTFGGRRLLGPPRGTETRPTTDRVREAIFNVLGPRVEGARVLDLFAGTGALGIEALSRGARFASFVETDSGLCQTIQTNLDNLEIDPKAREVLRRDVRRGLKKLSGPYDIIFLDPPYGYLLEREALGAIAQLGLLAPGGVAVVEHAGRETVTLPRDAEGLLVAGETRPYGDTAVTFFSPAPVASAPAPTVVDDEPARSSLVPPSGRRVAIYAGSFDPPTNGHFDIIRRATQLFDLVVVAVANNPRKQTLFTAEERIGLLLLGLGDEANRVECEQIDGLLVDYARRKRRRGGHPRPARRRRLRLRVPDGLHEPPPRAPRWRRCSS